MREFINQYNSIKFLNVNETYKKAVNGQIKVTMTVFFSYIMNWSPLPSFTAGIGQIFLNVIKLGTRAYCSSMISVSTG